MRRSPPTGPQTQPAVGNERARRNLMNRYATIAQQHWQTYALSRVAALPDPTRFFSDLGAEVEAQVSDLAARIAAMTTGPCSGESYLEKVARFQTARRTAEEVVMAELVWIKDPELPLPEAREEWEQTRPADENLISWAERIQDYPESMPSTDELEQMAQTWALSVEFLEGLVATEPPREYMRANQPALSEAANIRFWRELRRVKN
jgi:predicted metal-binding protein